MLLRLPILFCILGSLLAVSDAVWNALIPMVGGVILAYIGYMQMKLKAGNEELKASVEKSAKVQDATHSLVNGIHKASLYSTMMLTARIAKLSDATEDDIKVASIAKKSYEEHVALETKSNAAQPTGQLEKASTE